MVVTGNENFYELLGVSKTADEKEIKAAYKKAARKYHPDNAETGDEEKFKKLGEAYEVLKDPQKRQIYDQYGAEGLKGMGGFGGAGGFGDFAGGDFGDLGDIFSSFFGGGAGFSSRGRSSGPRASRGQDQSIEITLKFLDPLKDIKKKIRFNPLLECTSCEGTGAKSKEDIVTCNTCGGSGQVASVQNTILGQIRQVVTCPSCSGTGKAIKNKCGSCNGKAYKRQEKEIEVTIPAGVYDGANMRLAGIGDAGRNGGPPGDIYLYINVEEDKKLKRDRADVFTELTVDIADAALGFSTKISTPHGEEELKVKAGTQSGTVETLKQKGFPRLNSGGRLGDMYVKINVEVPKSLNSQQKKLLEEYRKLR
jgi:molecular chaperone DnaJ